MAPSSTTWLSRVHLTVTVFLLVLMLTLVGLAATGRLRVGRSPVQEPETRSQVRQEQESSTTAAGRYQIEKIEDARQLLEGAGKLGFFGQELLEAWVFKYSGGYLQCFLETDIDGKPERSEVLPGDWPALLSQDEGIRQDQAQAFRKTGYILLAAMPSTLSIEEAVANCHLQLSSIFTVGQHGALPLLLPLHAEVSVRRSYRLYLSAGPMEKSPGAGFNLWAEHLLPIRGPFISRNPASEEFHVEGGKDLKPGKDILLLDRKRGHSRIRLKARFLGDGEVREQTKR